MHTSETIAAVLQRTEQDRGIVDSTTDHQVYSVPNGQKYGVPGHVPCDHVVVFRTQHGNPNAILPKPDTYCTFDGKDWRNGIWLPKGAWYEDSDEANSEQQDAAEEQQ